jgi:hypothetical protein
VTAEDLCLFARELFDESRSAAGGVARVWPKEFCLSVFNCGWSTGAYERALEGGFECFRECTRDLFIRFFEVANEEELVAVQRGGWARLPDSTQETYVRFGLANFGYPKTGYGERHPAFLALLRASQVVAEAKPRGRPMTDSACSSSA